VDVRRDDEGDAGYVLTSKLDVDEAGHRAARPARSACAPSSPSRRSPVGVDQDRRGRGVARQLQRGELVGRARARRSRPGSVPEALLARGEFSYSYTTTLFGGIENATMGG